MTTKRGSIHFAIPLPAAMDPASLERLSKVITDAHAAIGAFTAAIAGLGGSAAYKPKGERKGRGWVEPADTGQTTGSDWPPAASARREAIGPQLRAAAEQFLDEMAGTTTTLVAPPAITESAADLMGIPEVLRK